MFPKKNKGAKKLYFLTLSVILLFLSGLVNCTYSAEEVEIMEFEQESIENVRAKYEQALMGINGVVSVSTGLNKEGKSCLKIGTSIPIEQVYPKLPEGLNKGIIELEYVGNIQAQ